MKKLTVFDFIVLSALLQNTFSQSYFKLFSDYLPVNYLNTEDKREQVDINLNQLAQINPDLIYYYIKYLNLMGAQRVTNRDSNYYNMLQYGISVSSKQNNDWVMEEIEHAEKLAPSKLIFNRVESKLEDFIVSQSDIPKYSVELEVDKNLQKYFSYKCLTKDTCLSYNETLDYTSVVDSLIEKSLSESQLRHSVFKNNMSKISEADMQKLHDYHLFSKGFSGGHRGKIEFNLAEYLLSSIHLPEFTEHSGFALGFNSQTLQGNFPGGAFRESHMPFLETTFENTENKMFLYNLTAGYKFKLKEYKTSFSYLNFNLGCNFLSSKIPGYRQTKELNKYVFIWSGEPGNFVWMFDGVIKSVSWEINKLWSLASQISSPIFYLNNKLFFEAGVTHNYIISEYAVTVEREIRDQTANDPAILASEKETVYQKTYKHMFGGSFSANYSITNALNIKGTISTSRSVQIGVEYFFPM